MKIFVKTILAIALVLALLSGCRGPDVIDPIEAITGPQVTIPVDDTNPTTTPSEVTDPTVDATEPSTDVDDPSPPSEGNGEITQPTEPTDDVTTPTEPSVPSEPTAPEYALMVFNSPLMLKLGCSQTITCNYSGPGVLTWESSDESIVTVDSNGKVTAKKPGTTEIEVTDGVKSATCTIIVKDYTFKLNKSTITLFVGRTETLVCTNTGSGKVTWSSDNASIATVDSNGKVTAKKPGTTEIEVTDGVKTVTCKVIVQDYTFKLNKSTITLFVGRTETLACTNTASGKVTWSSDNASIATVDSNGKVTAKKPGTTEIEVTDGVKTATCKVIVRDYTMKLSSNSMTVYLGWSQTLTCEYTGSGKVTWSSDDASIATVDSNGKVTAKKPGKTEIEARDGVKTVTCTVVVEDYTLCFDRNTITLEVGESTRLSYEYDGPAKLTWESKNSSIATVNSDGKVTAKKTGTAIITLRDGYKNAQCAVTVKSAETVKPSLTINTPDNTIMFVGETMKLDYTYKGSGKLTFESWDTSRLTIDSNGKMKAISEGIVGVAVTDGNLYKFIDILVKSPEDKATSIKMTNMQGPLFDGVTKYVGDYMSFRAYSKPDENPIKVSTSNAAIVAVDSKVVNTFYSEITLTYKAAGSAVITLTSEDGQVVYKYKVNVKAEYDCYPGKEKLTPQEFADACTQVMVENGFTYSTGCTSYRVLTLRADQLTWTKAKGNAQGYVSSWYPNGCRKCWISYEGTDEKGNYIFYTRWA